MLVEADKDLKSNFKKLLEIKDSSIPDRVRKINSICKGREQFIFLSLKEIAEYLNVDYYTINSASSKGTLINKKYLVYKQELMVNPSFRKSKFRESV